jgi:hypothetical protein
MLLDDWPEHSYQDFYTTKVDCWRVLLVQLYFWLSQR